MAIRYHHRPREGGRLQVLASYVYLGELLVIDGLPMEIITRDLGASDLAQLNLSEERLMAARRNFAGAK